MRDLPLPSKPLSSVIGQGSPGSSFYSFDYNRVHFLVTTAGALINDGTLVEEIINIEVMGYEKTVCFRGTGDCTLNLPRHTFPSGLEPPLPNSTSVYDDILGKKSP